MLIEQWGPGLHISEVLNPDRLKALRDDPQADTRLPLHPARAGDAPALENH